MPSRARAIVIGASAGAVEALSAILPLLPRHYPLPVIAVVHLAPDKNSVMAKLLQMKCRVDVREIEDKEPLQAGTVYIAPPDYHVLVEADDRLSLSSEEPVLFSRPSIDVLFESAADVYGEGLVGVVLTGANSDGSQGLRAIYRAGGSTVVQCPKSAYASAMPESALAACPGARVLGLPEIAAYLIEVAGLV
ncbi:MAG: chemotaxis protein CheB [Planctomycetia bacterium]|nr:chemotaxis protein CheB [Planctomycetia bacterium]